MKYAFFFVTIIFSLFNDAHAQFNFFHKKKRIKQTPYVETYFLKSEKQTLVNGYFDEGENWVVFSDRENNVTYKKPGSDIQFKTLSFLEPCYVVNRKNNFVELVKYDPKLIRQTGSVKFNGSEAEYLGWVAESKMLLWRSSLKERENMFSVKAITGITNEACVISFSKSAAGDSLLLFSSPAQTAIAGKYGFQNLAYIYKQSEDGKHYLIGRSSQLTIENSKAIIGGWISADYIKTFGARLYLTPRPPLSDSANLCFYADSINTNDSQKIDRYYSPETIIEKIFPVKKIIPQAPDKYLVETGMLANVLDRSDNAVINVLGRSVGYNESRQITEWQSHLNIVFVIDGGKESGKYMRGFPNILQALQTKLDTTTLFRYVKYGAVIYKDDIVCSIEKAILPLTSEGDKLIQFIIQQKDHINKCNNDTLAQAMFTGLLQGTDLLGDHEDETNIIVLIGGAGNNMQNGPRWKEVLAAVTSVNARLLAFQTHNISHPAYNDFVIQAKDLVLKSALENAESKKDKLIEVEKVLPQNDFSLVSGDYGVYFLDYPTKSMIPGYVLFPAKNQSMPFVVLERNLDSLIKETGADNQMIAASFDRYFKGPGIKNTRIEKSFQYNFPGYSSRYLPIDFLQSVPFDARWFYMPVWLTFQKNNRVGANRFQQALFLSNEEYEQVQTMLLKVGELESISSKRRGYIYRRFKSILKESLEQRGMNLMKDIDDLSFADVLVVLTGYRTNNAMWNEKQIRMIRNKRKLTAEDLHIILQQCSEKGRWIQENVNDNKNSFMQNGQRWHLITAAQMF